MFDYHKFIKRARFGSQFFILLAVFVFFLAAYTYFVNTAYFDVVETWAQNNYERFVIFLFITKVIGIVWPPLPGVIPIIAAIPVIGWVPALIIDSVGYMVGATIAFLLSRYFGMRVIRLLFGEAGVREVNKIKIKPNRELEAITLMKIFGGGIAEFISYAAGITNMRLRNFLLGSIISLVVVNIPMFYYFDFAFSQNNLLYAFIPLIVGLLLFYFLRRRYFELE